jgi:hypothetical protein
VTIVGMGKEGIILRTVQNLSHFSVNMPNMALFGSGAGVLCPHKV